MKLSSFADYVDQVSTDYTPGELNRSKLIPYYPFDPQKITQSIAATRFKFQPNTNNYGQSFQDFFNMQVNPNSLFETATQDGLKEFNQFQSLFNQMA